MFCLALEISTQQLSAICLTSFLSNGLLQDLGCSNPLCRDNPTDIVAIRRVAEKLKCVLPSTLTNLEDEWRVYQLGSDEVPKLIEEYSAAMVKPQSLKEPDRKDSDDDMGPESHSPESYISAVAPIFFGHCVLVRLFSAKSNVAKTKDLLKPLV